MGVSAPRRYVPGTKALLRVTGRALLRASTLVSRTGVDGKGRCRATPVRPGKGWRVPSPSSRSARRPTSKAPVGRAAVQDATYLGQTGSRRSRRVGQGHGQVEVMNRRLHGEGAHEVTGCQDVSLRGDVHLRRCAARSVHDRPGGLLVQLEELLHVQEHAGADPGVASSVRRTLTAWRPVLPVRDGVTVRGVLCRRVQRSQPTRAVLRPWRPLLARAATAARRVRTAVCSRCHWGWCWGKVGPPSPTPTEGAR